MKIGENYLLILLVPALLVFAFGKAHANQSIYEFIKPTKIMDTKYPKVTQEHPRGNQKVLCNAFMGEQVKIIYEKTDEKVKVSGDIVKVQPINGSCVGKDGYVSKNTLKFVK